MKPSRPLFRTTLLACVLYAASAAAVPDLEGPLRPDLKVGKASKLKKISQHPRWAECPKADPPRLASLPFGPGETLEFEADILGYEIAALESRVEAPAKMEGHDVLPIYAEVHSDLLLRVAVSFDGEMRSWLDKDDLVPVRSVSRLRGDSPKSDLFTRDDVVFSGTSAHARYRFATDDSDETKEETVVNDRSLQDVLSVIYHARSLDLREGLVVCHDVYAMGGVVSTVARVEGKERVDVDYDERDAFKVKLRYGARDKAEDTQFVVTTWISDDRERLPLRLLLEEKRGSLDLELDDVER